MKVCRAIAAVLLAGTMVVGTASSGSARTIPITIAPLTAGPGTAVHIETTHCRQDAEATIAGKTVTLYYDSGTTSGTFTVPERVESGTYTVTIKCGDNSGTANLVITGGNGSPAGDGSSLATTATDPKLLGVGAATAAAGAIGVFLMLLRRKRESREH